MSHIFDIPKLADCFPYATKDILEEMAALGKRNLQVLLAMLLDCLNSNYYCFELACLDRDHYRIPLPPISLPRLSVASWCASAKHLGYLEDLQEFFL